MKPSRKCPHVVSTHPLFDPNSLPVFLDTIQPAKLTRYMVCATCLGDVQDVLSMLTEPVE